MPGRRAADVLCQAIVSVNDRAGQQPAGGIAQWWQRVGQQPAATVTSITGAPPAAAQPSNEGGAKGIREEDSQIDLVSPEPGRHSGPAVGPGASLIKEDVVI